MRRGKTLPVHLAQKTHGIDDALIQPYSGHHSRTSLEIYSKIGLTAAQDTYEQIIGQFPV
jgi:integrase/recombinase XerD